MTLVNLFVECNANVCVRYIYIVIAWKQANMLHFLVNM